MPILAGQVELLFLGTGTSAGIPMIGCHCAVCDSTDSRDKRTRPSVVISYGQTGYIAMYRFVVRLDEVRILALRHQRELGYLP